MNKKTITIVLSLICVIGIGVSAFLFFSKDRVAPVISYTGDISYSEGDDLSVLFNGVTAIDDKDGDVSNTLMIESLYTNNDTAKIVYCAYDTSNNVAKLQRIIPYYKEVIIEEPEVIDYNEELRNSKIYVLNGTITSNVAAYWKEQLELEGFNNIEVDTSDNKVYTTLIYSNNENYNDYLSSLFPLANIENGTYQERYNDAPVVILVGEDYNTLRNINNNNNNNEVDNIEDNSEENNEEIEG